jgi:hypothetical protein
MKGDSGCGGVQVSPPADRIPFPEDRLSKKSFLVYLLLYLLIPFIIVPFPLPLSCFRERGRNK